MKSGCCICALIIGGLLGTNVRAGGLDGDGARALVGLQKILLLEEILRRNKANIAGRIIELELEHKDGLFFYEIKILGPDGRYKKLRIDAKTGALLDGE